MNRAIVKTVEIEVRNLPWAEGSDRLYKQPGHVIGAEAARGEVKWLEGK